MEDLGLYVHIPFCARKCSYCDFLSFPAGEGTKSLYASALIREIRGYGHAMEGRKVSTVFFGGGTPSVMPVPLLRNIIRALDTSFDLAGGAEVTMEVNPGTVDGKLLPFLCENINRVSVGVQSFDDGELAGLGRIHSADDARRTLGLLKEGGIRNISLDLMYGIPGQTVESWKRTLEEALSFEPAHISAYSLIVEEGTPYHKQQEAGQLALPDEDTEREMFAAATALLGGAGYERYEISNYAKPGFRSRHNMRYWKRRDCLGLGLGAASLVSHVRWHNTRDLEEYLGNSADPGLLVRDMDELPRQAEAEEFMFLGLRMTEGVSAEDFRREFGLELLDIYGGVMEKHIASGLMRETAPGSYALTGRGMEVSNRVLADYLL